eukprot:TRINITY_DN6125_c0_g1_i1.p1 TRINITY_DN6125_c0_g1~~TRINITY_DN6125_c0_g1_i1.p1  ORF type:complete len:947 (+),score=300.53 TRINITY_DN6125_c0_g1_i1:98-2842(+)
MAVLDDKLAAAEMAKQVIHWNDLGISTLFACGRPEEAVSGLAQLLQQRPDITDNLRDNVGAALIHWAVIHRGVFQNRCAKAVVDYLVREHTKEVVNSQYRARDQVLGMFDGESALHLAVAFNDQELIGLLIENGADLCPRAYGSFFAPGGQCYFGEYPLSFAVACGNKPVCELLVAHGGRDMLERRDSYGNTALHLAVIHRRPELFDWLLERFHQNGLPRKESLGMRGALGLTPLGLAAVLSTQDQGIMFDHVLGAITRVEWIFGRVKCTSIPLNEIETVALDEQEHISVLSLMLCLHLLPLSTRPQLVALSEAKWALFGFYCFVGCLAAQLAQVMMLSMITVQYQNAQEGPRWNSTNATNWTMSPSMYLQQQHADEALDLLVTLETCDFVAVLVLLTVTWVDCLSAWRAAKLERELAMEARRMAAQCPRQLQNHPRTWANMQKWACNVVSSSGPQDAVSRKHIKWGFSCVVPISEYDVLGLLGEFFFAVHFAIFCFNGWRPSAICSTTLSAATLLSWLQVLKFAAFSQKVGMLVRIVVTTFRQDFTSFTAIYLIFLFGFSAALEVIQTVGLGTQIDTLFKATLGDTANFDHWTDSQDGRLWWVAKTMHVCFGICSLIVLLNLLISVFSCTFNKIQVESEQEWRLTKGRLTLLYERRLRLIFPGQRHRLRVNHYSSVTDGDASERHRFVTIAAEGTGAAGEGAPPDADPEALAKAVAVEVATLQARSHIGSREATGDVVLPAPLPAHLATPAAAALSSAQGPPRTLPLQQLHYTPPSESAAHPPPSTAASVPRAPSAASAGSPLDASQAGSSVAPLPVAFSNPAVVPPWPRAGSFSAGSFGGPSRRGPASAPAELLQPLLPAAQGNGLRPPPALPAGPDARRKYIATPVSPAELGSPARGAAPPPPAPSGSSWT